MNKLVPYLFFNGNCEEALNLYAKVLNGKIEMLSRYKDVPPSEDAHKMDPEAVMHATLTAPDMQLMASDGPGIGGGSSDRVSLSINFTDDASIESAYNQLSEGGKVTMPLQDTFWGARFGMCEDKFGIAWMFNYDKHPQDAPKAEEAMAG